MIFAFGVIAALTLFLIFMVIKNQQNQRELQNIKSNFRKTSRHLNHVSGSADLLMISWQKSLVNRLNAAHKRGLISEQDANILGELFNGFTDLLHSCLNEGRTLEESLVQQLSSSDFVIQDLKDLVKKYPKDIRMAWTKNNAEGLILVVTRIGETLDPTKVAKKETPSEEAKSEAS